jgi:hypothetical protein
MLQSLEANNTSNVQQRAAHLHISLRGVTLNPQASRWVNAAAEKAVRELLNCRMTQQRKHICIRSSDDMLLVTSYTDGCVACCSEQCMHQPHWLPWGMHDRPAGAKCHNTEVHSLVTGRVTVPVVAACFFTRQALYRPPCVRPALASALAAALSINANQTRLASNTRLGTSWVLHRVRAS